MSYDDYDQDAAEARFDDEMAQLERIADLESLVKDIVPGVVAGEMAPCAKCERDCDSDCPIVERMTALGLLDGDAE